MMPCVVILNAVKNLKVSVAVDGSTSLEILRYTQDDIEPTMARRCFALLSMTLLWIVILNAVKNLLAVCALCLWVTFL